MTPTAKTTNPFKALTRYFLSGTFVLLPLVITIAAITWLVGFLIRQLGPQTFIGGYLKLFGVRFAGDSPLAYAVGLFIVLVSIMALGFIVDIGAKKYIKNSIDMLMKRIPFINRLYNISVQIVNMFNTKEHGEFEGMSVVYCFFGGEKGAAFIALMPMQQKFFINGVDYNVILIPSAPVPVGGSMMLVPAASIIPANMSIEDFMKVYVSMGAASADIIPKSLIPKSQVSKSGD